MKILLTERQFKNLFEQEVNNEFIGSRVMVYYNLHKHTFSVTYKSKVILHADYVNLKNVEFRVRKGGKEKVRDEKRKNVHAFVIGDLVDYCEHPCKDLPEESSNKIITYETKRSLRKKHAFQLEKQTKQSTL